MKKILFIDRDGTLIKENPPTYQIDRIEKVDFYPRVLFFLNKIANELDYIFVMVTNQDGLGSDNFPEESFWPIHNHILKVFRTEGIKFFSVHIDKTYPEDMSSTRKPEIGMLTSYFDSCYDLKHSFVIGDRMTDILLAKNIGCKSIWINENLSFEEENLSLKDILVLKTDNWKDIYEFLLKNESKIIHYRRKTLETNVQIGINLYGDGKSKIKTGLGFLDHLLEQMSFHSLIDLNIYAKGDIDVDEHHTVEDTAITLGEAFHKAIDTKIGIERYGFFILPMDDCLSTVALDISGRSQLSWNVEFIREKIGQVSTEMFIHFFKSFSSSAKCNLYIKSIGKNDHHKIESIFKAFSISLKMAIKKRINSKKIPSSKGLL
ncbi:bifunctional histidinol-phosphatase/imidazoleglycerol-phosphate dehydratase HisB [Blattabacterium cuenoti]|uniref:bifunctional histidinol-phosphatase/imidazoleglycerol-phosphate dehydratase HisB n=1 Tax=Blattabacterium cuenoti TaxID=1653831 RepID=UPI00163CA2C4|nr:bifunctional histidinol-phosphatase/imidazoleglycerol-phosphate dehydratase HisB [Blattabacterium cuenoti]